ncbi:MAG TPA: ATP-binding cassette domain-containing protein, partial [Bacteroidia bacterium]|nr:ATP-binding cassette domain-containing protein [Bacteroidia bacterium]
VEKMVASAVVSPAEYQQRQQALQAQAPILEVRNLKTYFPQRRGFLGGVKTYVHAVDDVSFSVYPGETLGLVGESGCGKTPLGRSILRLVEPTAGEVFFEGRSVTAMNQHDLRALRKDLQIIFQDPYSSLNPRITIGNAILEPMRVHGLHGNDKLRLEKVEELLSKVNLLPEHFRRYPHEFSGGQRQRACIARALAVEPKFIVCDESVSALDVSVQAQVLNLLIGLREEFGFTYIFISHDLSVVKFMSDRMVVMNKGKIEEMGLADEIYAAPGQEYTRNLIQAIPKGDLASIEAATAARKAIRSLSGQ